MNIVYKKSINNLKKELQQQLQKEQEISTTNLAILVLDLYKKLDELEYEIEHNKENKEKTIKTNNKEIITLLKYFK